MSFWIWQPLHQSLGNQQAQAKAAAEQLVWLQTQLPLLSAQNNAMRSSASLNEVVSQTAQSFQIQVSRMQPQNDQMQVMLNDISFDQLLAWLHELQYQHNVSIVQLDLAVADAPGMVRVRRLLVES